MRCMRFAILTIAGVMAASTTRAQQAEVSTADTPAAERDTADLLLDILQEISELRESVAQLTDAVAAIQLELTERRPGIVPGARPADAPAIGAGSGPSASPLQDPAAPPKSVLQAPEERVFSVTLVKEWGRSIEEAQRLSTTSLVGQVLAVPPWSTREELENLGKELRAKFAAYDNVNIEVFNDRAVAASYAERPVALNAAARVLTVSKVLDSGRDKILLFVDGDVIEVQ